MKSDAVICEEIYMDMIHKAKQMYDMIHAWPARPHKRKYFCQSNYGNIRISFGGTIRTLPIY